MNLTRVSATLLLVLLAAVAGSICWLPVASLSASEVQITDLAVHIEAVRIRFEKGETEAASALLDRLLPRYSPGSMPLVETVELALLLARAGRDADASRYFRTAAANESNEDSLDARERAHLAAAMYAIGRPARAADVLRRCKLRWQTRSFFCRQWAIAEVAAAKDDWNEAAQILDRELMPGGKHTVETGIQAPIRVLKLRLRVAWHRGNKLEIGRWRSILIRRGVAPDSHAGSTPDQALPASTPARRSGLMWIVTSLSVVLLSALLLARRA